MLSVVELGDPQRASAWTGCLLHGFGASAQDLVPVAVELSSASGWILPHAPVPITVAGMSYGRAWFPRSADDLEQALFGGYFQTLRALEPQGLWDAANEVSQLLNDRSIDPARLVLGGFSQGAMVAAEVLRQALVTGSPPPARVLLFSGALVAESWWRELATPGAGKPGAGSRESPDRPGAATRVWWAHGERDAVLPLSEGVALADALERAGITVERHEFAGGHEISAELVRSARTFLADS